MHLNKRKRIFTDRINYVGQPKILQTSVYNIDARQNLETGFLLKCYIPVILRFKFD